MINPEALKADAVLNEMAIINEKWSLQISAFMTYAAIQNFNEIGPDSHEIAERFLKIEDYMADLKGLYSIAWPKAYPSILSHHSFRSFLDYFQYLPESFLNVIQLQKDNLFELACAFASPPQYGSKAGRYPEQMDYLKSLKFTDKIAIRDYGCGTGQGTYELAEILEKQNIKFQLEGITFEALEVWMAVNRCLPHCDLPDYHFPECNSQVDIHQGDIINDAFRQPVDIIIINGLIGGPILNRDSDYQKVLERLTHELKEHGTVLIADSFHDGYKNNRQQFRQIAETIIENIKFF